jgi:GcrA cell cycle regulator
MIHSEETKAQVSKLWADGKSAREVGAEIGMTRNAVIGLVHRLGLPKRETDLRRGVRGWTARKMKPVPPPLIPAPDPIGPIGDFPARDTCHHIAGEPNGSFQCCGHKGYPFCEYHTSRVYLPKRVAV